MAFEQMIIQEQWFDTNGDPFSGAVLKAYEPGTTTNISIFINDAGGSPQSTITLNAAGKYEVSGNEILPYIDRPHKWALFSNATDAAADSNPFAGFYDNVPLTSAGSFLNLSTVAAMVASTSLSLGDTVVTQGYTTIGDGGDNTYTIVAAGTGTDDGGIFIDLDTHQAQGLFPKGIHNVNQWGAVGGGVSATANTIAIQAAIDWMVAAEGRQLFLLAQDYSIDGKLTVSAPAAGSAFYRRLSGYGARLNSSIVGGIAFQVGDGTGSWGRSVMEGFRIDAPTADTVFLIDGVDVEDSTFRDLVLIGDTATPANVDHVLLILGARTFFNRFEGVQFNGANYCVSINFDFTTSTDNASGARANANRFDNCFFTRAGITGVFINGSVGNSFNSYDFSGGGTPNLDFHLAVGSGFVSSANYFQGRHQSSALNEFQIDNLCLVNTLIMLVEFTVVYANNATEEGNIEIKSGGDADIKCRQIITTNLVARFAALDVAMDTGRCQFVLDRFAPRTSESGAHSLGINEVGEVAKWKQLVVSEFVYQSTDTAVTAFATGGQTNATVLTANVNRVNVAAAPGDSVKLPDKLNLTHTLECTVFNSTANAIDIFPFESNAIEPLAINTAISLAAGAKGFFKSYTDLRWIQLLP